VASTVKYGLRSLVEGLVAIPFRFVVNTTNAPDGVRGRGYTVARQSKGVYRVRMTNGQKYFFWYGVGVHAVGTATSRDIHVQFGTIDANTATGAFVDVIVTDTSQSVTDYDNQEIAGLVLGVETGNPITIVA